MISEQVLAATLRRVLRQFTEQYASYTQAQRRETAALAKKILEEYDERDTRNQHA